MLFQPRPLTDRVVLSRNHPDNSNQKTHTGVLLQTKHYRACRGEEERHSLQFIWCSLETSTQITTAQSQSKVSCHKRHISQLLWEFKGKPAVSLPLNSFSQLPIHSLKKPWWCAQVQTNSFQTWRRLLLMKYDFRYVKWQWLQRWIMPWTVKDVDSLEHFLVHGCWGGLSMYHPSGKQSGSIWHN